jgi:methylamine dehydrogenase accessory protein MauD
VTILIVAVAMLFVVNVGLTLAVLALARQVGVLFERISPMGALTLTGGPKVGDAAPVLRLRTLAGADVSVGVTGAVSQMLFFLSPTCPVCKKLLPALRALAVAERGRLEVLLASDGKEAEHLAFWQREKLGLPYVLSPELGMAFQVAKLPYAVVIGPEGRVRAKGLVNSREQLESLLEAEERGVASMQEYMSQARIAADVA